MMVTECGCLFFKVSFKLLHIMASIPILLTSRELSLGSSFNSATVIPGKSDVLKKLIIQYNSFSSEGRKASVQKSSIIGATI